MKAQYTWLTEGAKDRKTGNEIVTCKLQSIFNVSLQPCSALMNKNFNVGCN